LEIILSQFAGAALGSLWIMHPALFALAHLTKQIQIQARLLKHSALIVNTSSDYKKTVATPGRPGTWVVKACATRTKGWNIVVGMNPLLGEITHRQY
jgi:hypothetical protein